MVEKIKNKKISPVLLTLLLFIIVIMINVLGINRVPEDKTIIENIESVNNIFDRGGISLVYIGRDTCSWSQKFVPHLRYLKKEYNFDYDYIDTDLYNKTKLNSILSKFGIKEDEFGTPTIAIVKNGKVLDVKIGYVDEQPLFEYLQENKIIEENATYIANPNPDTIDDTEEDYEYINYVNYDEFEILNDGEDPFILVIGQTGCSYCDKFKPVINQISKDNSVAINYIDIKKISNVEFENLINNIDYFDNKSDWGTPLTLVINKKQTVDNLSGYVGNKELRDFLNKNKLL